MSLSIFEGKRFKLKNISNKNFILHSVHNTGYKTIGLHCQPYFKLKKLPNLTE